MIDQKTIKELRAYCDYLDERKQYAKNLMNNDSSVGWYFAICGLNPGLEDIISSSEVIKFKVVKNPPLYTELVDVIKNKDTLERVSFYSRLITYEIQICLSEEDWELAATIAYNLVAIIRIKCGNIFLVPIASNCSWAAIPAATSNSVKVKILEDHPNTLIYNPVSQINQNDIIWAITHWYQIMSFFVDNPQIGVAIDSLSTFNQHDNPRMCVASLWSGIESIFGIETELRFRLAAEIAAFLEPRGSKRVSLHNKIKKLYDFRSKAVHGHKIDNALIQKHISEVELLLRQILIKCIDNQYVPTKKEFEEQIHL